MRSAFPTERDRVCPDVSFLSSAVIPRPALFFSSRDVYDSILIVRRCASLMTASASGCVLFFSIRDASARSSSSVFISVVKNESNDIQDEIQAIQKERVVYQEESLKNYVSLQEDLISTLKSLSQEEVDTIKAKYDAIEEADNKYLDALSDAIEKQRKLRDLETSYTDLAAKEKQLALMQRDTSGANQSEIQSLTDEIDTDRQKLLDTEVDNLVDSLKELYEQQKEARDAEIEYMETVTESADHFAKWAQEDRKSVV